MNVLKYLMEQNPLLIKVTQQEYAESFLAGQLFMNSLHTFRNIEDKGLEMTRDTYEGAGHVTQSTDFDYLYSPKAFSDGSDWKFPSKYVIGGVWGGFDKAECSKIFCLYNIRFDLAQRNIEPIDSRILHFGNSFICIRDIIEFANRVNNAVQQHGDSIELPAVFRHVDYIGEYSYTGAVGPFRKRDIYCWQNEYRLCVNLKEKTVEPFTLNIGDISDIAFIGDTKEMFENIRFIDDNKISFVRSIK